MTAYAARCAEFSDRIRSVVTPSASASKLIVSGLEETRKSNAASISSKPRFIRPAAKPHLARQHQVLRSRGCFQIAEPVRRRRRRAPFSDQSPVRDAPIILHMRSHRHLTHPIASGSSNRSDRSPQGARHSRLRSFTATPALGYDRSDNHQQLKKKRSNWAPDKGMTSDQSGLHHHTKEGKSPTARPAARRDLLLLHRFQWRHCVFGVAGHLRPAAADARHRPTETEFAPTLSDSTTSWFPGCPRRRSGVNWIAV